MKNVLAALFLLCLTLASPAQEDLDFYLPKDVSYNPAIVSPQQFFQQSLGEWHLSHDQVLNYIREINRLSERAILYEYARSHENRPLVHLVFTSEENQGKLGELKELHLQYANPEKNTSINGVPLVVCLNYGVHGNESSATNSSVLTAYYLAAAQGAQIDSLLAHTIILVDPCMNPDGFTRHSTWANMNQGAMDWGDPNSRQFSEGWLSGRTNHYWFDLNRDYLLLVHPESQGKVARFHEWKPNVVTDHHESSPNSTFFFQPGVPSRINPLTPPENHVLTKELATYHARYLDAIGSYYFSEEVFDDYYFGKGSSYPDINAGIGILFEQASFRGRVRETDNGIGSLAQAIKNQFTVSLSTLEGARRNHNALLKYQREFYRSALDLGANSETKAYIFGSEGDRVKTQKFIKFLNQHQIEVYENLRSFSAGKSTFQEGSTYVVPVKQKQYRLITSIFEKVTSFQDTSFYDVSTWTIPYAMDIPYARIVSGKDMQLSEEAVDPEELKGEVVGGKSDVGYLMSWNEYTAARALYHLQGEGLRTHVASKSFSMEIDGELIAFDQGCILIRTQKQELNGEAIFNLLGDVADETGIDFYSLTTGLSPLGIDMGSSSFYPLSRPEVLLFVDGSTSSYLAGEIWHLFDQVCHMPLTRASTSRLRSIDLNRYSHLILPGGSYGEWNEKEVQQIKDWIGRGGILITVKDASTWASKQQMAKTSFKEPVPVDSLGFQKYGDRRRAASIQRIGGAILNAKMDLTHPLCYGYVDDNLAIMKRGAAALKPSGVPYAEPVRYEDQPYLSGWVSDENLDRLKGTPVVSIHSEGRGKVISYHEDMNFRGIWLGTHKLFANSLFFGGIIR